MAKKLLCLILAVVLSVSVLAACGDNSDNTDGSTKVTAEKATDASAQNNTNGVYVYADVDAMTAVEQEQADDFALQVVDKRIEKDYYTGETASLGGKDAIIFKIQNPTDKEMFRFKMLVFCTDENGKGTNLGMLNNLSSVVLGNEIKDVKYSNAVTYMSADSADLAANSSLEYAIRCDSSRINTVNIIVYSYIDESGKEFINPACKQWLEKTYEGMIY